MKKKIDAFLDKTPISIGSMTPKDETGCSHEQLDRHSDDLEDWDNNNNNEDNDICHIDDASDEDDELEKDAQVPIKSPAGTQEAPEDILLPLPSHLGLTKQDQNTAPLVEEELIIRQSQASEALEQLRLSLGIKSALFRKKVRQARSQDKKTRAWKAVHAACAAVEQHARSYVLARHALVQLEADELILTRFSPIAKGDLVVNGDVVEENRVGQRSDHVSWIWRLDIGKEAGENDWMEESE